MHNIGYIKLKRKLGMPEKDRRFTAVNHKTKIEIQQENANLSRMGTHGQFQNPCPTSASLLS